MWDIPSDIFTSILHRNYAPKEEKKSSLLISFFNFAALVPITFVFVVGLLKDDPFGLDAKFTFDAAIALPLELLGPELQLSDPNPS